ncbi:MAG: hypothetical protein Q8L74_17140 [Nitrospirota bacterium]|nr:hypothetical protein [Nitrospirota bacterium]
MMGGGGYEEDDLCLDLRSLSVGHPNSCRRSRSLGLHALETLNASDAISINTDTLQLTGGATYTGMLNPVSGASILAFDDITGTSL